MSRANLRRIATMGDGWIPIMGSTPDDVAAGLRELRADPALVMPTDSLTVQAKLPLIKGDDGIDLAASVQAGRAFWEAGATDLIVSLRELEPDLADVSGFAAKLAGLRKNLIQEVS
jgi:hypothetical protein